MTQERGGGGNEAHRASRLTTSCQARAIGQTETKRPRDHLNHNHEDSEGADGVCADRDETPAIHVESHADARSCDSQR